MVTSAKANLSGAAPNPSRRELLSYALGASVALAAAGSCGGLAWFTQQQLKKGVLGGVFDLDLADLPLSDQPVWFSDALTWLTHTEAGLLALDSGCVYDQVSVRWSPLNHRFECPLCGSKYQLDGTWIEFSATRDLDRYVLEVRTPAETRQTPPAGTPISIRDAESVRLYTDRKIPGESRLGKRFS